MRVKSKILQKIYACFALICFVSTLAPAPGVFADTAKPAKFPSDLGTIRETFQGDSSKSVILIQDAHANSDAQTSIRKLIDHFQKKSGINFIALEGGWGPLDLALLRAFPDQKAKEFVMDEYVRAGELSGAEMAAVVNVTPSQYVGIEDAKLYEENKKAFFAALEEHEKNKIELSKIRAELEERSLKIDSPELRKLRTRKVEALAELAKEQKIDIKKFSGLEQIVDALKEKLFQSEAQRALDREFQHFEALERISRLEATREDVRFYATFLKEFKIDLKSALKFYDLALKRDQVFGDAVIASVAKQSRIIFIAGGFHTDGVKQKLKQAGISYQVITPKISTVGSNENYLKVMCGEFSYAHPRDLENEIAALGDDDSKIIMRRKLQEWRMRFSGVPTTALPILDRQLGIATLAPSIQTAAHPQHQQFLDAASLHLLIRSAQTTKPKVTIADVVEKLEAAFGRSLGFQPGDNDEGIRRLEREAEAGGLTEKVIYFRALEKIGRFDEIHRLIQIHKLQRFQNPEIERLSSAYQKNVWDQFDWQTQGSITRSHRLQATRTAAGPDEITLSADKQVVAALFTDKNLRVWNLANPDPEMRVTKVHNAWLTPDPRRAFVRETEGGPYLLRNLITRETVNFLEPGEYWINVTSKNGLYSISVHDKEGDKILRVRDLVDGRILHERKIESPAFLFFQALSPDGNWLLAQKEGVLFLQNLKTGEKTQVAANVVGHEIAEFSEDSSSLSIGMVTWDLSTGTPKQIEFNYLLAAVHFLEETTVRGPRVGVFHPNRKFFISSAGNRMIEVHSVSAFHPGYLINQFETNVGQVRRIVVSPDGGTIVVGGEHNIVEVFQVAKKAKAASLGHFARPGSEDEIRELGSMADASPADLTARLRHLHALERAGRWFEIYQLILDKKLPRDEDPEFKRLFDAARVGLSSIYDLGNSAEITEGPQFSFLINFALTDDAKKIVTQDVRTGVSRFDLRSGEADRREINADRVHLSPNGKFVVLQIAHTLQTVIHDLENRREKDEIQIPDWVGPTVFSNNGRYLAYKYGIRRSLAHDEGNLIRVWDLITGRIVYEATYPQEFANLQIKDVSNDGKRLILSIPTAPQSDSARHVILWSMENGGRQLKHIDFDVRAIFSPDGRFIVSDNSSRQRYINVWDANTGEKIGNLNGSQDWHLLGFAFRPGTNEILIRSTLRENEQYVGGMWNLETLKRTKTLPMGSKKITAVAFSPDGEWAAVGDVQQNVHMFHMDERSEVEESSHFPTAISTIRRIEFNPIASSIAVLGGVNSDLQIFHFAPRPGYEAIHQKLFPPSHAASLGELSKEKIRAKIESLRDLKQKIESNTLPELVYFGDKHGEIADLEEIVAIAKRARARGTKLHIIGHGDAFDRGSSNVGVWRIFRELQKMSEKNPNICVTFILGNHDVALIRDQLFPYDGNERRKWRDGMGGDTLVREFNKKFSSDESIEKLKELALWVLEHVKLYEVDEAGILHVHAGIPVNKSGMPAITLEDLKDGQSDLEVIQKKLRARPFTEKEPWLASRGADGLMQAEGLMELFDEFSRVINVRPQKWVDLLSKEQTLNFLAELGVNGIVVGHQRSDTLRQHGNWIFLIDAGIGGINEHFLTLTPEGLVWHFLGVPIQKVYERNHLLKLIADEITWLQVMEAKSLGDDRLRALERAAQARPDDASAHAAYLGELIRIGRRSEVPEYFIRNNLRSFHHSTLETYFKESIPYAARETAVADNRGIQFERSLDLPVPQSFSESSFHADNFALSLNGDTAILGQNGQPISYSFDLGSGARSEISLPNISSLFSPDARRAVVVNQSDSTSAVSLFDLENKRGLSSMIRDIGAQYDLRRNRPVCVSDDGFLAAVKVKEDDKQYIYVFNTNSGTQVSKTEISSPYFEQKPFALSLDGTLLVAVSTNEKSPSWSLYDLSSGSVINHRNHVLRDAVFSPDGKKLAITWQQRTDPSSEEPAKAFIQLYPTGARDYLYSIEMFASDIQFTGDGGKFLALNGGGGVSEAVLFDTETGNRIRGFSHRSPNITGARTSRALLHPSEKYVITGGNDGYVRVWDIETGQKANTIALQSIERATRLYMNPVGTKLLASGPRRGEGRRGTGIDVFRILKNSELPEPKRKRVGRNSKAASLGADLENPAAYTCGPVVDNLEAAYLDVHGNYWLTKSLQDQNSPTAIQKRDLQTGAKLVPPAETPRAVINPISGRGIIEHVSQLIGTDIQIWDFNAWKQVPASGLNYIPALSSEISSPIYRTKRAVAAHSVMISPNGLLAAKRHLYSNYIQVVNLVTGNKVQEDKVVLPNAIDQAEIMGVSNDGKRLILRVYVDPPADYDYWLWDFENPKNSRPIGRNTPAFFAPDGERIVSQKRFSLSNYSSHVWDSKTGKHLFDLENSAAIHLFRHNFDISGDYLIAGDGSRVGVWDISSSGAGKRASGYSKKLSGLIDAVALSPDGKTAFIGDENGRVEIASVSSFAGKHVGEIPNPSPLGGIRKIELTHDGSEVLVTADYSANRDYPKLRARIFHVAPKKSGAAMAVSAKSLGQLPVKVWIHGTNGNAPVQLAEMPKTVGELYNRLMKESEAIKGQLNRFRLEIKGADGFGVLKHSTDPSWARVAIEQGDEVHFYSLKPKIAAKPAQINQSAPMIQQPKVQKPRKPKSFKQNPLLYFVTKPANFDWEKYEPRLPKLENVDLGLTNSAGRIDFRAANNCQYPWRVLPFGEEGWRVVIKDAWVRGRYFQIQLGMTKEGREPITRNFLLGPFTRILKQNIRNKNQKSFRFLNIIPLEGAAADGLSELVLQPGNLDLVGLSFNPISPRGIIAFSPTANYPYDWNPLEGMKPKEREGYRGIVISQKIQDGYFRFTVEFQKEGSKTFQKTYQVGPYRTNLDGEYGEKGKSISVFEIVDAEDLGKKHLYHLLTSPLDFNWNDPAAKFPSITGAHLGTTNPKGLIFLVPKTGFQYFWPALGTHEPGWEARVTSSGMNDGHYQFEVEFTKQGEPSRRRSFHVGPETRILKNRKSGENIMVWAIQAASLGSDSELAREILQMRDTMIARGIGANDIKGYVDMLEGKDPNLRIQYQMMLDEILRGRKIQNLPQDMKIQILKDLAQHLERAEFERARKKAAAGAPEKKSPGSDTEIFRISDPNAETKPHKRDIRTRIMRLFREAEATGPEIRDAFEDLGAAHDATLEKMSVDRTGLLQKINSDEDLHVFQFEKDSGGKIRVSRNPKFFDPTLKEEYIDAYRMLLQIIFNEEKDWVDIFTSEKKTSRYFDFFALSDFQYELTQRYHRLVELYGLGDELFEKLIDYSLDYVKTYLSKAYAFERSREGSEAREQALESLEHYRKFALENTGIREKYPRAVLLARDVPKRVVSVSEASWQDWNNPEVMIVDNVVYQALPWRKIPEQPQKLYPGERVLFAQWKGKFFLFYSSRSHTVKDSVIHQWRSTDAFTDGQSFAKNRVSENLDDARAELCILLDRAIYSTSQVPAEKFSKEVRDRYPQINEALRRGPSNFLKFKKARLAAKAKAFGKSLGEESKLIADAERYPGNFRKQISAMLELVKSGVIENPYKEDFERIFNRVQEWMTSSRLNEKQKKEFLALKQMTDFVKFRETKLSGLNSVLESIIAPFRHRKGPIGDLEKLHLMRDVDKAQDEIDNLALTPLPFLEHVVRDLPLFKKAQELIAEGKKIIGTTANSLGELDKELRDLRSAAAAHDVNFSPARPETMLYLRALERAGRYEEIHSTVYQHVMPHPEFGSQTEEGHKNRLQIAALLNEANLGMAKKKNFRNPNSYVKDREVAMTNMATMLINPNGKNFAVLRFYYQREAWTLELRDIFSGEILKTTSGNSDDVPRISYSLDGNHLLLHARRNLRVFDLREDWNGPVEYSEDIGGVMLFISAALSANGRLLATFQPASIRVRDIKNMGSTVWEMPCKNSLVAFSHDGQYVFKSKFRRNGNLQMEVFDFETGRQLKTVSLENSEEIRSYSGPNFSPSHHLMAITKADEDNEDDPIWIYIYDIQSGRQIANKSVDGARWLYPFTFSPDDNGLYLDDGNHNYSYWRLGESQRQGKILNRFGVGGGILRGVHRYYDISPDGRHIIGALPNGNLALGHVEDAKAAAKGSSLGLDDAKGADAARRRAERAAKAEKGNIQAESETVRIALKGDLSSLSLAEIVKIRLFMDRQVEKLGYTPKEFLEAYPRVNLRISEIYDFGNKENRTAEEIVHTGVTVVENYYPGVMGFDPKINGCDLALKVGFGARIIDRDGRTKSTWSSTGKPYYFEIGRQGTRALENGENENSGMRLWDLENDRLVARLPMLQKSGFFHYDENRFDYFSGNKLTIVGWETGAKIKEVELELPNDLYVQDVLGISEDVSRALILIRRNRSANPEVLLYDLNTGKIVLNLGDWVNARFSRDSKYILAGNYEEGTASNVQVIDAVTGNILRHLEESAGGSSFTFSPDLKHVFINYKIYSMESGKLQTELPIDSGSINFFSPDGKVIFIYDNERIRAFDVSSGRSLYQFNTNMRVQTIGDAITFSKDGSSLIAEGIEEIKIFHFAAKPGLEALHAKLYPPAVAASLGVRQTAIRLLAGKTVPNVPKEVKQLIDQAGVIPDEEVEKAEKASRAAPSAGAKLPVTEMNNVVLALHVDSLPDEVSPKMIQIFSQVKKLILVFPQGDERGERIYESLGPKKAVRFSYVGDIPVRDIQRELEKERGAAKGFLTQNLDLVADRLKTTREKISYFSLDGRQYRETLAENALALILNLTQNPGLIHEWQGVARAASLGNGAIGISFDLGALVERLTVINDSGKSLARAA